MALSGDIDLTEKLDFRKEKELPVMSSDKGWRNKIKKAMETVKKYTLFPSSFRITYNSGSNNVSTVTWNSSTDQYYYPDDYHDSYRIYDSGTTSISISYDANLPSGYSSTSTVYYVPLESYSSYYTTYDGTHWTANQYSVTDSNSIYCTANSVEYPWDKKNYNMRSEYSEYKGIHRKPEENYTRVRFRKNYKYDLEEEMEDESWVIFGGRRHRYWSDPDEDDIRERIPWLKDLRNWIFNDYMRDLYEDDFDYSPWLTNMRWLGLL